LGLPAPKGGIKPRDSALPNPPGEQVDWLPLMAVPKRKTSKARRDKRRAQHAISAPRVSTCENCGSPKQSHRVCPTCKTYRGREVRPLRAPAP
jgi:large subunit ribosomal protein L32